MSEFPEADWKVLRGLKEVALDRFCKRFLEEAAPLVTAPEGDSRSYHERYLALFNLLHRRDEQLGAIFNDLKRSTALIQLANMRYHQLLTDEEFMRFSPETRDAVQAILESPRT